MALKMGGKIASIMKAKAAPKVGGGLTTGGGAGAGMPKPLPSPASPRARVAVTQRAGMGRRRTPTKVGGF